MLDEGLKLAVEDMRPVEFEVPDQDDPCRVSVWIKECEIRRPEVPDFAVGTRDKEVYPTEARQRGTNYKGQCLVS